MAEKLKVKFVAVIWGARYIREFARVSMPSYLSAGNLPYLARETDLEVLIMTTKDSREKFDKESSFAQLRALCPVRYIFIDDLVTFDIYGVTLTLAHTRAIHDSGTEQTNTYFIFMNSDFILADGSLITLVDKLRAGHRCIMAPSLRVCWETTVPLLVREINPTNGTLTMPPRRMVKLAFDHLHPTVTAKTVTQNFLTCSMHNQIYWQVDESTLLARHYLIFQLAIKPEVPIRPVNTFSDYGFVPELIPSGQFTILDDSDKFFMLEIQHSAQEKQLLRCGTSSLDYIAKELSAWATHEHRRFAEVDIVFRSSDLPPGFEGARAEFAGFMASLKRRMLTSPINHVDHFYWTSGVQAWISCKYPDGAQASQLPAELDLHSWPEYQNKVLGASGANRTIGRKSLRKSYAAFLYRVRRAAGEFPNVPIWHHLWMDSLLVRNWVESIRGQTNGRNLLVCNHGSPLQRSLPKMAPFEVRKIEEVLQAPENQLRQNAPTLQGRYGSLFVHIYRADMRQTRKILEGIDALLAQDREVAIYLDNVNGELEGINFSRQLAQEVHELLPSGWIGHHLRADFAGGMIKRRLRLMENYLFGHLSPSSPWRLPLLAAAIALWPGVAVLTTLNNFLQRRISSTCPKYCSSALLVLSRSRENRESEASPTLTLVHETADRASGTPAAGPLGVR
jgi:hypothetical protein